MFDNRVIAAILVLIALLLAANLIVQMGGVTSEARADIVEGKNVFSTHSPDGQTVYLWGYTQTGSFNDSKVEGFYYGKITPAGWLKNQ